MTKVLRGYQSKTAHRLLSGMRREPGSTFTVMFPRQAGKNEVSASIIGMLHLVHFNWSTHNAMAGTDFHPVNLDRGYFWVGNRLWFGIYMHGNHHKRPQALNPLKLGHLAGPPVDVRA